MKRYIVIQTRDDDGKPTEKILCNVPDIERAISIRNSYHDAYIQVRHIKVGREK